MECAEQELREETGLECDLELKGLFSAKTYNNSELAYNHQMFIIKATNPRGTLIEKTREGINQWFSHDEIKELAIFPNVPESIKIIHSEHFRWVEADRFQERDVFKEFKVLKDREI